MSSAYFNRVVLVGNLTHDIELRYTHGGTAVTDISLAVNERVKRNDEWIEEANFFTVTFWGRTAEVAAEYLEKGGKILVEGRLKQERWEQEGEKRTKVKVVADKMQMLGSPKNQQKNESKNQGNQNEPIPF
jgi:single-strand DNA-binding protein